MEHSPSEDELLSRPGSEINEGGSELPSNAFSASQQSAQSFNSSSAKPPTQRLMITKMILENFKSYAGEQEIGPFHKRFSSIVGPNGSGKSNVIDALLFVFGKRAKQLRLNKVSELIHKSSGFPDLEYARVSVHFQQILDDENDDDAFVVVADSEFTVTRTAFKNNQSKYSIGNKTSNYTEVGLLLRKHGIDLDNNRFLILQGEVEQIAMMKPKALTPHEEGLLEYLEDIIGSNRFVEQIDKASASLDGMNEQRVEKVNRLKVAERERDNLQGSKGEAELFIEKEKDIRRKKNILYQLLAHTAAESARDLKERQERAEEKLAKEQGKLKESEARLAVVAEEHEILNAEYNKVTQQLQKAATNHDSFERRDVKLQEDMKHQKTQIRKHQATVAKESKKEEEMRKEGETMLKQIEKFRSTVSDFEGKKAAEEQKLEEIMEGLRDATQELRLKHEAAQIQLSEAEKSASALQTDKEQVQNAVRLIQERAEKAQKDVRATESRIADLQRQREEHGAQIQQIMPRLQGELAQEVAQLESVVERCTSQEVQLQRDVRDSIAATELAKAQLASQNSKGASNALVDRLLKAAQPGGPLQKAGIVGRLGDLGRIAPEYDVAISTACGYLDYCVTETTEGAQMCIQYLRANNLGRASFIALNQMQDWAEKARRLTSAPAGRFPAGVPKLFELITPVELSSSSTGAAGAGARDARLADMLQGAFFMAVRETLVARDLESAVKIAYVGDRAAFRVVALDGNLIDNSGAMSGGGSSKKSGGMKLTTGGGAKRISLGKGDDEGNHRVTPESIVQLEAKTRDLQAKLQACRAEKAHAEREIQGRDQELKGLRVTLEKLAMALERLDDQEAELVTHLNNLQQQCALTPPEEAEIEVLNAQIAAIEEEIVKVSPNLRSLQQEVASLQRQIRSVGGPKLAKCQSLVDSYSAQIDTLLSTLATKEVEERSTRKQAEKAAQLLAKAQTDLGKAEGKLSDLESEQAEMERDATELIAAIDAAKLASAGLEEQLTVISAEYTKLKNSVATVKSVELDLGVEIDRARKEGKESAETARRWLREAKAVREAHVAEQRELLFAVRAAVSTLPAVSAVSALSRADTAGGMNERETEMEVEQLPSKARATAGSTTAASSSEVENEEEEEEGVERLAEISAEDLTAHFDSEQLKRDINLLEAERNKMKSSVNMGALIEYLKKDAAYKARLVDLEAATEARNALRKDYELLRRQRLDEFMGGFGVISLKLKEMYQMITLGGDAELELVDSLDPFSEGVVFSVRPPKKSWKNISNLSGGEKTLSSLALVFALHHYKPTPLYVMDEIDAALDFKNVSIVANYIKDRTKDAQFVIISLRNNMFELADRLVGIYKTHDATKSVTINPKMFLSLSAPAAAAAPVAVIEADADPPQQGQGSNKHSTATAVREKSRPKFGEVHAEQSPKKGRMGLSNQAPLSAAAVAGSQTELEL